MISDTLANYISRDFSCIFGLSTLEMRGSLFLVSPLNKRYTYPSLTNASIDFRYNSENPLMQMNEWSKESGIYTLSSDDILDNAFISSNNDWNISTILNLAPTLDEAINNSSDTDVDENYSFLTTISFDTSKIQSLENLNISYEETIYVTDEQGNQNPSSVVRNESISLSKNEFLTGYNDPITSKDIAIKNVILSKQSASKIQLFKQGFDNLDGILDCFINVFKTSTEYFGTLTFKVYYFNGSGVSTVNLHEIKFDIDNNFINNFINNFALLTIILDSKNGFVKLFVNDQQYHSKQLDLLKINKSTLNYPVSNSNECKKLIIGGSGSKCLEMRDFFVFDRSFLDYELKFFSMVNQGKFIKKYEKYDSLLNINPLTFTAKSPNSTVYLTKNGSPVVDGLQYRMGTTGTWLKYNIDANHVILLQNIGDKVQFRNIKNTLSTSGEDYVKFIMDGNIEGSGDIQSMLNYSPTCGDWCYYNLFGECTSLTKAPELTALSIGYSSYRYMFFKCSNLIESPELPATEIGNECYFSMFENAGLKTSPSILPALTLTDSCYKNMFKNCENLVTVPELPAMALTNKCYDQLFRNTKISRAPELLAIELAPRCYSEMFKSCKFLNYIKVHFTSWDTYTDSTNSWLADVSTDGSQIFVKPEELPIEYNSNRIPFNWIIQTF